jgi:hypothetical protein
MNGPHMPGPPRGPLLAARPRPRGRRPLVAGDGGESSIGENTVSFSSIHIRANLRPLISAITNTGTDYIGVYANTGNGTSGNYIMCVMCGTFTSFHRAFTEGFLSFKEEAHNLKMIMLVV